MADQDQGLRIRHGGKPAFTVEYHALKSSSGSPLPSSAFSSPGLPDGLRKNNFRRPYRGLEWYSVLAIFVIGLWSTLLSGAWFVIAVHKPHWDFISSNDSVLTPTTASTLTTALAKTIEVSFVSFFLAIVGQYFTRKASDNEHSGISLADLQLKVLMVLSGTLITSWKSYGRVLRSFVGITSLIACVSALLYTTASDALVSPKPSTTSVVKTLYGKLQTTPANKIYIQKDCPATDPTDKENCIVSEHAGLAYTNFEEYLKTWQQLSSSHGSVDQANRPAPMAIFQSNVTVQGSWVDSIDTQAISQKYNRTITNVSMAMPHSGVLAAANIEENNLPKVGNSIDTKLYMDAQTVLPSLNVLCAQGTAQEISPLIYDTWPHSNPSASPMTLNITAYMFNSTVFDPIFGFQQASPPPVFDRLPGVNNSILNVNWNAASTLYLLLPSNLAKHTIVYNLCGLSMGFKGGCSSELSVTTSTSILKSNCAQHDMSYNQPLQFTQKYTPANWTKMAYVWAEAVALDTGLSDNNAATPRMLAELAPGEQPFDPDRPSLVEALAILGANTLLDSMVDAPFNGSWPYPTDYLKSAIMQPFLARVSASDYASGPGAPWQNVFMLVLVAVFAISLTLFGYLLFISAIRPCLWRLGGTDSNNDGLRQDHTDWSELFEIALNSPRPGQGSPICIKQGEGKLRNMKWHFRDSETTRSSGELGELSLAFDGDNGDCGFRGSSPKQEHLCPSAPDTNPDDDSPRIRGFIPVPSEDSNVV